MVSRFGYLAVSMVLLAALLSACGSPSPTAKPSPTSSPSTPAALKPSTASSPSPSVTTKPSPTSSPAPTSAGPSVYAGKSIQLVVGAVAGGGTDIISRVLALHLPKFIPGKPSVVVRNIAGGGGIEAWNYVFQAKPDGLTTGMITLGAIFPAMLKMPGVKYDIEGFYPLIAMPQGGVNYASTKVLKNRKDIINPDVQKTLIFGSTAVVGGGTYFVIPKQLFGLKIAKEIYGYGGDADSRRAFLAGETNFSYGSSVGYNALKPYIDKGEVIGVWQTGLLDAKGNVIRDPLVPDVPTIPELYQEIFGKPPSGPIWDANKVIIIGMRTYGSKTLLLSPKVPADIQKVLDQGIAAMVKDPAFVAEVLRVSGPGDIMAGDTLRAGYGPGVTVPQQMRDWAREIYSKDYGVVF